MVLVAKFGLIIYYIILLLVRTSLVVYARFAEPYTIRLGSNTSLRQRYVSKILLKILTNRT